MRVMRNEYWDSFLSQYLILGQFRGYNRFKWLVLGQFCPNTDTGEGL